MSAGALTEPSLPRITITALDGEENSPVYNIAQVRFITGQIKLHGHVWMSGACPPGGNYHLLPFGYDILLDANTAENHRVFRCL